jgi:predicted DsbA family dithiol-disulfide isomerase
MKNINKIVEVIEFTDPVCTWCWGSEPTIRKLETVYGNQLKVSYVMGGLVRDIRDFNDPANGIGGSPEASNRNIASHWVEASGRHGMPVNAEAFNLFSDEHPSTYPMNIAYKAAQLVDEEAANIYLRLMREATIFDGRLTNRTEVLIEMANEAGVDLVKFLDNLENGNADEAFQEDLKITSDYGVRGFPTFLVKYGEKEMLLRGYQDFDRLNAIIKSMTAGEVVPNNIDNKDEDIFNFLRRYYRVAPAEIMYTFDISAKEIDAFVEKYGDNKVLRKIEKGNGYLIEFIDNVVCDPITGICSSI